MPPEMVDVNVHPTKLEVRFQDAGRIYSQMLSTLRNKFLASDLRTEVRMPSGIEDPTGAHDDAAALENRQELIDWAKGKVAAWHGPTGAASTGDWGTPLGPRAPLELARLDRPWAPAAAGMADFGDDEPGTASTGGASGAQWPPAVPPDMSLAAAYAPGAQALQVHNRYLVTESEDGVVVIDQHALHERILYEQLRQRIEAGAIETQSLLVPEPVDLGPAEAAAVLENQELLARLGVKVEPFGGDTVLVAGYPAMLANIQPAEVLRGLVDRLLVGGKTPERRDLLDELLHSIACKAAVKAGDRLAPAEIDALLQQRHLIDDAHHCPHGRPTALVFTREELDKQFKRV
jgi:DNA mismatch repair protein MutL